MSPKRAGSLILEDRKSHASPQLAGTPNQERGTKCRASDPGHEQCRELPYQAHDKIPYGDNRQRLLLAFLLVSHCASRLIRRLRRRSQDVCVDFLPSPGHRTRSVGQPPALFCYIRVVDPPGSEPSQPYSRLTTSSTLEPQS